MGEGGVLSHLVFRCFPVFSDSLSSSLIPDSALELDFSYSESSESSLPSENKLAWSGQYSDDLSIIPPETLDAETHPPFCFDFFAPFFFSLAADFSSPDSPSLSESLWRSSLWRLPCFFTSTSEPEDSDWSASKIEANQFKLKQQKIGQWNRLF